MQILEQEPVAVPINRISPPDNSDELSVPHIHRWNHIVSTTNWEKGTLILAWRNDLIAAGLEHAAYTDDAWARRVDITPQHVNRLRRVAERFAAQQADYAGLYWSHFNAAVDWNDAELWLEGAAVNRWSVAQMKVQRAETVGADSTQKPDEADIYVGGYDSAAKAHVVERTAPINPADVTAGFDADNIGGDETVHSGKDKRSKRKQPDKANAVSTAEALTKLQCLQLPADLMDALEPIKLAVLNHKAAGWKDVSQTDLADCLDKLKNLVYAAE